VSRSRRNRTRLAIVSTLSRDETIDGFDWPKGETKWPVPIDIEIEMRRMPFVISIARQSRIPR
jgi:hypothetical protein